MMLCEVTISGETVQTSMERESRPNGKEAYAANVSSLGYKRTLVVLRRSDNELVLSDGERVFRVKQLRRTTTGVVFLVNGEIVSAELKGGRRPFVAGSQPSSIASVSEVVISNFPARVVKVNFQRGDKIGEDQTLIVLEAMKMEAQVKVPKPCIAVEVLVKEGDLVERGRILARLRFEE